MKGDDGILISVVSSKTSFDGLNQVDGIDTVCSGGQGRRWKVGAGEGEENRLGKLGT